MKNEAIIEMIFSKTNIKEQSMKDVLNEYKKLVVQPLEDEKLYILQTYIQLFKESLNPLEIIE